MGASLFENAYYLRGIFNKVKNEILGDDYTNKGTTMTTQDLIAAEEIIYAYKSLKRERNTFLCISLILFICYMHHLLFGGL